MANDEDLFDLKPEDLEEMYEDINNLYLKYYDRYIKERGDYPVMVKGSVILAIIDLADKLNITLMNNEIENIIKRLRGMDE